MRSTGSSINKERIKKLQKQLSELKVDACLIDYPLHLYYLTGLKLSKGELFIDKKQSHLFVDGRYIQTAQERNIVPATLSSSEVKEKFLKKIKIKTLAFDSDNTSYHKFLELNAFAKKLKLNLKPVPNPLKELRALKDKTELEKIRSSAKHLWKAFQHIKKLLRPGITEAELALELKLYGLKHGAEGTSFEPIIAFGPNSALPHHRAGNTRLKKGDIVLIDIGLIVDQYYSDMTRTLFFGPEDPRLKKFYQVVRNAHASALRKCKPGATLKDLDIAARQEMKKQGLESYYIHNLGHGVGLEIHEFPSLSKNSVDKNVVLKKGMVVTIEPGLYLPGKGGVRWEDTIIITDKGYENLYPEGLG